jgi:beta-lactamase regulating signal transducer with metallopeptidase domain
MGAGSSEHFATGFLAIVAAAAVRAMVLAAIAGVLLILFRVKNVSLRLAVWKLTLWSALAMPALVWTLPPLPLALPGVVAVEFSRFALVGQAGAPAESQRGVASTGTARMIEPQHPLRAESANARPSRGSDVEQRVSKTDFTPLPASSANLPAPPSPGRARTAWKDSGARIALAFYLAVAGLLLSRLFIGWILSRRLIRAALAIRDSRASMSLSLRAFPGHLRETPLLAESRAVSVPVTLGVARPVILLPPDWREWESDKLDAVLAHELSHIGRNDALTQRLAKLHRAIYWFSPLAWWLDRELAWLGEEASDEAALASGADRERYAEMLLRFFEAIRAASGRVWWQGVSMAAGGDAAKRVDRILSWKGAVTMRLRKTIVAGLVGFALPVLFAAASIHITARAAQNPPRPPIVPAAAAAAPQVPTPSSAPDPRDIHPPAPPATGIPPTPQLAPAAPLAPVSVQVQSADSNVWVMDDEHVREPYVIAVGGSYIGVFNHAETISDSNESQELAHAKALRAKIGGDFIWFEHEGKGYVIRDRATIDRAAELYKPIRELGAEQDALGKKQDELGKQQEELGGQMEEVKVKIPDMSEDLERIKVRMREISANGGTQSEIGDLQAELGELQGRIGEIQSQAGREQSRIGRQQGELGRKQGELGRQQGAIGRKQGEYSKKALQQMESLLAEARAKGLAQPE